MGRKGFPQEQLPDGDGFAGETVRSALVVAADGKPETVAELRERIRRFFEFCGENDFRPGVEALSAALGVSRVTFWNWCRGGGCGEEWQQECQKARRVVSIFLEQSLLTGRISPPSGIFLLKNYENYKDTISFDDAAPRDSGVPVLSNAEIARQIGAVVE